MINAAPNRRAGTSNTHMPHRDPTGKAWAPARRPHCVESVRHRHYFIVGIKPKR